MINSFFKTWWHCLSFNPNYLSKHRMCKITLFSDKVFWCCSCSPLVSDKLWCDFKENRRESGQREEKEKREKKKTL